MRFFTTAITWLAGLLITGLALWFLWASRQGYLHPNQLKLGAGAVIVSFVTLGAAIYLRHRVGFVLLDRGELQEVLRYCKPRSTPTLTVGRDEAAANSYAAAEALRRQGHPAAALTILEAETRPPRSKSLQNLLTLARAQTHYDLERFQQSSTLLSAVQNNDLDARGREHAEHLRSLLHAMDAEHSANPTQPTTPHTTAS